MSPPIQRARHSSQPEGAGNATGFGTHGEAQRDLWEMVLRSGHLRTAALHGAGVLRGLKVAATLDAPGLTVSPGLALSGDGRLLAVTASDGPEDFRVRLRPTSAGASATDGLATVDAAGVVVPTDDQAGVRFLILDWQETLLIVDSAPTYRLTPWLRLEAGPDDPAGRWAVLARVDLGSGAEQGRVKDLDTGPRVALPSLGGGLALNQPLRFVDGDNNDLLSVDQIRASGLRARLDGGLEVGTWSGSPPEWRTAFSVDGDSGHIGIGAAPRDDSQLSMGGSVRVDGSIETPMLSAGAVAADAVSIRSMALPIVRSGSADAHAITWLDSGGHFIHARIDTSAAGFPRTPSYFSSLGSSFGNSFQSHGQFMMALSAIFNATPTSFEQYLFMTDRAQPADPLTSGFATSLGLFVSWVGMLAPP